MGFAMDDIGLISVWRAVRTEKTYVNFHEHNYYELVYYQQGHGTTTVGGKAYTYADGRFMLIPPHMPHDETHDTDTEVICLECAGVPELTCQLYEDSRNTIYKILNQLLAEVAHQDYGYQDMIAIKLKELFLHVLRNENVAAEEKNFEYIINYLKENYHERIVLSDCAKQLSLSYDYFQHTFKKLTGFSPRQFLVTQRLQAAEKILESGDVSCTEIAYRCGFSTSAQFSALFKREYGKTPLQYRKQQR